MSDDFLELSYDKFLFRVKKGYLYHPDECWVREDGDLLTIGVTDFFQRTAGDMVFVELPETGTEVTKGGEAGLIETIKTTVTLLSPVGGVISGVNTELREKPERVNADPYGEGWLFKVVPSDWESDRKELMEARSYFPQMEAKIKGEEKEDS